MRAFASELGLAEQVKFLGSLSEEQIIEELRTADVFALASHAEPLGVVYMEAMARRADDRHRSRGVGEIIRDREDGLLFHPATPKS